MTYDMFTKLFENLVQPTMMYDGPGSLEQEEMNMVENKACCFFLVPSEEEHFKYHNKRGNGLAVSSY